MPLYDLSLEELKQYRPELTSQPDMAAFWEATLAEAARLPLDVELERVDYPASGVSIFRLWYRGWRNARIASWLLIPHGGPPFPALVQYHGYSGSAGEIHPYLIWALQGFVVLAVDVRGQAGDSADPGPYTGGHIRGWMTQGILDPQEYYYRGVYVDCVRALDVVASLPDVSKERIGILGVSQGGGLTLAVAGLDRRPALAMPELPYLCHFQRAVDMAARHPYLEIAEYIMRWPQREQQVWRTLSYFDNMNLAGNIACPVLMNVGLQDDICPPSTVYASYNRINSPKEMIVYRYHNHVAPEAHWIHKMTWAQRYLRPELRRS